MNEQQMPKAEVKAFGLIRDINGKPRIDDLATCPEEILAMLTPEELEELK